MTGQCVGMGNLRWPSRGTEALAAGVVTPHQLRTNFEMVYRNVYIPRGQKLTPVTRAVAAVVGTHRHGGGSIRGSITSRGMD